MLSYCSPSAGKGRTSGSTVGRPAGCNRCASVPTTSFLSTNTANLSESPCSALSLKENARTEHKQPVKRLTHEPAKVTLVQFEKQPHLPSRNRCISASSRAIQPAICSRENLRGSGSLAPCARKRVARNNNSSCFCSGVRASAAASISASVLILESYHSAFQPTRVRGLPQLVCSVGYRDMIRASSRHKSHCLMNCFRDNLSRWRQD